MSVTLIAGVQYSRLVLAPSVLVWVWLRGNLFGPRCLTRLRCLSIRHLPFRQQMYFQMKITWLIDFSNSSSSVTQKKGDSLSELQNFKEFNLVPLQCIRLQITSLGLDGYKSQWVFMLIKDSEDVYSDGSLLFQTQSLRILRMCLLFLKKRFY